MPSTSLCTTYATPVDVEILGSRLEAYVNTFPEISALRLCNRFGRGPHAAVTKLPKELIDQIVTDIILSEAEGLLISWRKDFRCYQHHCDPSDHLDEAQLAYWKAQVKEALHGHSPSEDKDGMTEKETANQALWFDGTDVWSEKHIDRVYSWGDRVGHKAVPPRGIFSEHQDFMLERFGLGVWVSHVTLDRDSDLYRNLCKDHPYWAQMDKYYAFETTTACITLPKSTKFLAHGDFRKKDKEHLYAENGYMALVKTSKKLSKRSRKKFRSMMHILALKPSETGAGHHGCKVLSVNDDSDDSDYSDDEDAKSAGVTGEWPKLVNLIQSYVHPAEFL